MKKIISYVFWPALAGLVFALIVLQTPRLVTLFPALSSYIPQPQASQEQSVVVSYSNAIKRAAPAVVSINSQQSRIRIIDEFEHDPSTAPSYREIWDQSNSQGSGVIIHPDGFIITNFHLFFTPYTLPTSEIITVELSDGRSLDARPVIVDPENDLALLKINAENLPYIGPKVQNNLEVGDVVLAIGNPRNIGQSASVGIISALLRREESYIIQTDAAINPGNSGGALIDINGNLIGINSTIISQSGGSEGIGLAIPAYQSTDLLTAYLNSNPSGYLGVENTQRLTLDEGMAMFNQPVQGLLVNKITLNSPAEKAGIKSGDVITALNSEALMINNDQDAYEAITNIVAAGPGQTVLLDLYRGSEIIQVSVTLDVGEPILSVKIETEELESNLIN